MQRIDYNYFVFTLNELKRCKKSGVLIRIILYFTLNELRDVKKVHSIDFIYSLFTFNESKQLAKKKLHRVLIITILYSTGRG